MKRFFHSFCPKSLFGLGCLLLGSTQGFAQFGLPFKWVDSKPSPLINGERGLLQARLQDTSFLRRDLPSKRVRFFVDDQLIGSTITNGDGIASYPYTARTSDPFDLKVVFEGDKEYNAAEKTVTITVHEPEKTATQISWVEAEPEQLEAGQRGLLKAKLEDTSFLKLDVRSKRVRFYIDDQFVATGLTSGSGIASIPYKAAATGSLNVKAVFEGDREYTPSEGTATVTVGEPAKKEVRFR